MAELAQILRVNQLYKEIKLNPTTLQEVKSIQQILRVHNFTNE